MEKIEKILKILLHKLKKILKTHCENQKISYICVKYQDNLIQQYLNKIILLKFKKSKKILKILLQKFKTILKIHCENLENFLKLC